MEKARLEAGGVEDRFEIGDADVDVLKDGRDEFGHGLPGVTGRSPEATRGKKIASDGDARCNRLACGRLPKDARRKRVWHELKD